MVHTRFEYWIAVGFAGAFLLAGVMAVGLMALGTYSFRLTDDIFVSRKRPLARMCFVLMSFALGCGLPVMTYTGAHDPSAVLLVTILCLPLGIGGWYTAGPQEFHLDIAAGTYRLVDGWPLLPRTRSGTTAEMWGVYVLPTNKSGSMVGIRWRRDWKRRTIVGQIGGLAQADKFAQELAGRLGLELVAPPKPLIG